MTRKLSCPSDALSTLAYPEKPVKTRYAQTVYGQPSRWHSLRSAATKGGGSLARIIGRAGTARRHLKQQ